MANTVAKEQERRAHRNHDESRADRTKARAEKNANNPRLDARYPRMTDYKAAVAEGEKRPYPQWLNETRAKEAEAATVMAERAADGSEPGNEYGEEDLTADDFEEKPEGE